MRPTPFPYDRWRRVRAADVEATRRALRIARASMPRLRESITMLGAALEVGLGAGTAAYRRTTPEAAGSSIADPCVLVRLGVHGEELPVLADVDVPLALSLVDRALGGEGSSVPAQRRPNPAEAAIVALLAARVVGFGTRPGDPPLRVLGVVSEPAGVARALAPTPETEGLPVHVFELPLRLGECGGGIRILVPDPLLARAASPAPGPSFDDVRDRLVGLGLRTHLGAEVGCSVLARSEVAGIEPGDVVLLDEATARPDIDGEAGHATLRLPRGRRPRFSCRLSGRSLVVERVDLAEEIPMQGGESGSAGGPGALLAEVPVEVVVVIGRVELGVSELLDLGAGDTLVLDRRPGDPVELRAGDRLLGRGELVEVDGKVGVQLLEVSR